MLLFTEHLLDPAKVQTRKNITNGIFRVKLLSFSQRRDFFYFVCTQMNALDYWERLAKEMSAKHLTGSAPKAAASVKSLAVSSNRTNKVHLVKKDVTYLAHEKSK